VEIPSVYFARKMELKFSVGAALYLY